MARRRSILKTLGLSMTSVSALGSLGSTVAAGEFTVGQRVATTVDLSVRSRPSLFASRREVAPEGATGYVRDGPREANGYTWWKIGYNDGYEGWSAEQYLTPAPLDDGSSGTTIEDSVRTQGERTFEHTPADGIERVVLDLSGPSDADLDLYATYDGRTPTTKDFDERSWTRDSEETITMDGGDLADTVGILVDAYAAGGEFTLEIDEEGGGDGGDGRFEAGQRIATTADLVIHRNVGLGGPNVWTAPSGSAGYVRDGPEEADGYTWWKVEFNAGYEGWCVERYLTESETSEEPADFIWPVEGRVTSTYYDTRVRNGRTVYHRAIDIGAPRGDPIVAARSGTVTAVTTFPNGGNAVFVEHDSWYRTEYHHMSSFAVSRGQTVEQGDVVGYVGSTGRSTGPHLHWEVVRNDVNLAIPTERGQSIGRGDAVEYDFPGF